MIRHKFSISEIQQVVKGRFLPEMAFDAAINDILIDSRRLFKVENTLFFALPARHNDGHRFIGELYRKGLRNFIISNPSFEVDKYPGANFILVHNTLDALQLLASTYRKRFDIPVIGITGSNGKTIVKEWLYQLISKDRHVIRSPKSYNSQIGVPLSVWQLEEDYDLAVFEAGISEPDEMERLQQIIRPTVGIFTNIGEAHSENFINRKQKIGEKLKLFTKVNTLVYCIDHAEIQEVIIKSQILDGIRSFTWSRKQEADLQITSVKKHGKEKTTIDGIINGEKLSVTIPFVDDASVENAVHCWATMHVLGYDAGTIAERMQQLTPIAMRLELKEGINNCTIINDSYNSDINSLAIALDFLNQQTQQMDKTVILSDILQSGKSDVYLYGKIAEMLVQKDIKKLIGIGPAISRQAEQFTIEKEFYKSTEEFLKRFSFTRFQNQGILLKGARVFEFEQISKALQQKAHETVFEINLNALVHNLNFYRSQLQPGTKLMAMVKAGSYGNGSFEIANALQFHNVDYLATAYADEGIELRKAGIRTPIMVMNPDAESFDGIIAHNLEPEIYSFRVLEMLERAIRRNIIPRNKPVKVHIKMDTGMHRLGFDENEIDTLIARIQTNSRLYVQSIFTHLAASEDPGERAFTEQQITTFDRISRKMTDRLGYNVIRHALNTAGITEYPHARFDMVRLGIGLYGISPVEQLQSQLENVSTMRSIISQIKTIPEGETIGYGRSGKAEHEMKLATVPIGYADGLSRILSDGRGHLVVAGHTVPIVGKICMDMCMVDVTGLNVKEGDKVIVFGKERSIVRLAEEMNTIPYEILTGISKRVKRIYFQE